MIGNISVPGKGTSEMSLILTVHSDWKRKIDN